MKIQANAASLVMSRIADLEKMLGDERTAIAEINTALIERKRTEVEIRDSLSGLHIDLARLQRADA